MDVYFERLKRRSAVLGNHHKKYLRIVEKNTGPLLDRLEDSGYIDRIHLWINANDPRGEMQIIGSIGNTHQERLSDLGCYFAMQFLQMNLSALDALMLAVTTQEFKLNTYKNFMLRVGHDFRRLTAAYMEQLLKIFLPENYNHEYVILGVGTRADQDDIDVGVIDSGPEGREELNQAIAKMNSEMFKKAVSLHFHLSEHVGNADTYSASLDEYDELLTNEIHDFVIISEMLGAARIVGSRQLLFQFMRQVTSRYYFKGINDKDLKFHEGYLRGIIGESRSFMFRELSHDHIKPKVDGLRMIKGGLYAAKTIYNLRQVNAWAIVQSLQYKDSKRRQLYRRMEQPLTFLEIFRYLYQLLNSEEEEINLSNEFYYNNLASVAEAMGYKSIGGASATDFLLVDYYNQVLKAKRAVKKLLPSAMRHLESVSVFGKVLHHKKVTTDGETRIRNLAERFLNEVRFFKGTRFWDDIVRVLAAKDGKVLKRLVNDLCALPPQNRQDTFIRFIDWGWNSFIAMFSILILIHKYRKELPDCHLFEDLNELFFQRVRGTKEEAQRLSIVFTHHPKLVFEYTSLLTEIQQRKFNLWLSSKVWDPEVLPARDALRFLLKLQSGTSKYFQRTMNHVLGSKPEYLKYINNPKRLRLIGKGTLGEIDIAKTYQEKLNKLLFYHDFQFFRVGVATMKNYPTTSLALQFNEFSDNYLRYLFDTVQQAFAESEPESIQNIDTLGIFVTGGHGQMQAFDDDYDLIILINSEDLEVIEYALKLVRRFHRELVKCGVLPHYHMAECTGSYICSFNQLATFLQSNCSAGFIDRTQLMNARLVIGSNHLLYHFEKNILNPHIFSKRKRLIKELIKEIYNRRADQRKKESDAIDLKEDPGGLRDIENFLVIMRVIFRIKESSNFRLLARLQYKFPDYAEDFKKLHRRHEFLRKIRNLSRLTIAADNILYINHLENLTEHLNIKSTRNIDPAELLLKRVWEYMRSSERITNRLLKQIVYPRLNKNGTTKKEANGD